MRRDNFKNIMLGFVVLLIVAITVGYASLQTTLTATGTTTIKGNSWNVHFVSVTKTGGVDPTEAPSIGTEDNGKTTELTYKVTLEKPGDFYEFEAVIKNDGSMPAKLKAVPTLTGSNAVTKQTVTYSDGTEIATGDEIPVGESRTIKVKVEFLTTITNDTLPTTNDSVDYSVSLEYVQA